METSTIRALSACVAVLSAFCWAAPSGHAAEAGPGPYRLVASIPAGDGDASGINDGAAAVVLAREDALRRHALKPLARIVSCGHAGVDPALMDLGPIPATRSALKRASLDVADLDAIESNEAFAAQVCAVSNELGFDPDKVNPNGRGIATGQPVRPWPDTVLWWARDIVRQDIASWPAPPVIGPLLDRRPSEVPDLPLAKGRRP